MTASAKLRARHFGVLLTLVAVVAVANPFAARAQAPSPSADKKPTAIQLTETQKAAIAKQLKDLREAAKGNILGRHGTAEQAFKTAASSPKAAVALYLMCYKEINFTRLEKEEREFRDWEDANKERLEFEPYAEAMQMQLHFLWMATRAAQAEDISTIFPDLTKYIDKIGSMTSPPHPVLDGSVGNTVFAEVYKLDDLLQRNEDNWELNPMNIGGIYEKTIYPFLRSEMPANLENAWDRRIQAETRLAELFIAFEEGMERMEKRSEDDPRAIRGEVGRMAGYVHGKNRQAMVFKEERLPELLWGKARDQYLYTNQALGAKAMLDLIGANLGHKRMSDWIAELDGMVNSTGAGPDAPPAAPAGT